MTDNEQFNPEELEIPIQETRPPAAPPPLDVDPVMVRVECVKVEIS